MKEKIKKQNDDLWEGKKLGATKKYARQVSIVEEKEIDASLGLQAISIRLQKELIEKLKLIAKSEGIGYQPLIRQVITRFVRDSAISKPLKKVR